MHRALLHPPKPRLAFRVGVVGHRPNRLKEAELPGIKAVLREILSTVRHETEAFFKHRDGLFSSDAPVLRAISPLAEGADRLFAEVALDLHYELCCPMPFEQSEYEKDFVAPHALEQNSLARFRQILHKAACQNKLTCFQLDGTREIEGSAYGTNGQVVFNQSDVLIVVWDGVRQGKRGGTEETFDAASNKGIPVIWIDSFAPHSWRVLNAGGPHTGREMKDNVSGQATLAEVKSIVRDAIRLPGASTGLELVPTDEKPAHDTDAKSRLSIYFAEKKPRFNSSLPWKLMRNLAADGEFFHDHLLLKDFEKTTEPEWPRDTSTPQATLVNQLRPFYAWADKLAVFYADLYRSAFITAYLLGATAVSLALVPLAMGWLDESHKRNEACCIGVELLVIVIILGLIHRGKHQRWHQRWLDYRLVAELISHLRMVTLFGGSRPFPQMPAHLATYGHPASTWMNWYARSIERQIGLPESCMTAKQVEDSLAYLRKLLDEQVVYHDDNARRFKRLEKNLHLGGLILLSLTVLACIVHLALSATSMERVSLGLTFLCGFLPAWGAALAAIGSQGEFVRIEKRSQAMSSALKRLGREADELSACPTSTEVAALSARAAQLLINETLDWRVVFLDQPLRPPA